MAPPHSALFYSFRPYPTLETFESENHQDAALKDLWLSEFPMTPVPNWEAFDIVGLLGSSSAPLTERLVGYAMLDVGSSVVVGLCFSAEADDSAIDPLLRLVVEATASTVDVHASSPHIPDWVGDYLMDEWVNDRLEENVFLVASRD